MPTPRKVQRITVTCDLLNVFRSPFEEGPPPGGFQSELRVVRSRFGAVCGGCAQQVPVNLGVRFQRWIEASKFSKHFALPCRRIRRERTVPVWKRVAPRFLMIVVAEMDTEQNID